MSRRRLLTFLVFTLGASLATAQEEEAETPEQTTPAAAAGLPNTASGKDDVAKKIIESIESGEEALLSGGRDSYNYDPLGRPDPFVNPMKDTTGVEEGGTPRPDGWPGMLINEVKLQGITIYGSEPIAMFLGTDGIGYFAREGDELWDGKIELIDFDEGLVAFKQKVEDPSSAIRHRRVDRKLHP